ncbi:SPOR domain-containing protein [Thiovibrio sp. JS02]
MAQQTQKKKFTIRFELGLFGLFSLVVVCFCLFFWMFLLGLWAGQTVFSPAAGGKAPFAQVISPFQDNKGAVAIPSSAEAEKDVVDEPLPATVEAESSEPSFFALQVAAFREAERAKSDVEQWRARGYDAFAVPPEDADDPFSRVYVGKFDKLADANQLAARLEKEEDVKTYIALLPASRLRSP